MKKTNKVARKVVNRDVGANYTSKCLGNTFKTHEQEIDSLKEQVNYWVRKWSAILRLQDWDIYFAIKRKEDMSLAGSQATMNVTEEIKTMFFEIIDPIDYKSTIPQDIEMSLVHELVHIHSREWPSGGKVSTEEHPGSASIAEEQAVHALASALIKLDRGFKYIED